MKKHLDKIAHVALFGVLILGAVALYLARFSAKFQFIVILYMVAFYLIWGFVYHHLKRDASKKLMIEYLIIGLIAILASFFVFVL